MLKYVFLLCLKLTYVFSQQCILEVPNDPLNTGLFQPWYLSTDVNSFDKCSQLDKNTAVFVESTILDIDTGKFFVYSPLVIDKDTSPAIPIIRNTLPVNHITIINIGSNGDSVRLIPSINSDFYMYSKFKNSLEDGNCINGFEDSLFGQVAYCNGELFFKTVNKLIVNKIINVPPIPVSNLGDICPTVRSFAVVDQDQSDNVNTQYIITNDMKIAQYYSSNIFKLNVTQIITNPSDNRLTTNFIYKAIGCASFTAPDLVDNGVNRHSLALNELSAARANLANPALIPSGDPMALINNFPNLAMFNAYRFI